jgi:hypothetical protein
VHAFGASAIATQALARWRREKGNNAITIASVAVRPGAVSGALRLDSFGEPLAI